MSRAQQVRKENIHESGVSFAKRDRSLIVVARNRKTLEADNLDAAITMASRIPGARLGGAIEVRPVAKYW